MYAIKSELRTFNNSKKMNSLKAYIITKVLGENSNISLEEKKKLIERILNDKK
jgi:hypothetical protein